MGPTARNTEPMAAVSASSPLGDAGSGLSGNVTEQHPLVRISRVVTSLHANAGELHARNQKLEQLASWLEIALNNIGRGLSMFDGERRLLLCNATYAEIYNLPESLTRIGTPLADILNYHSRRSSIASPDLGMRDTWITDHTAKLAEGKPFHNIQKLADGRIIQVNYHPLPDGGWVDLQEDITEKRRAEEKIEWLARHDALTEVANRFHFRERLESQFLCLDPRQGFALHWIDLDHFKEVNDTLGHPVGDALLTSVAKRLRGGVRTGDFLARLGGDEFAVIQAGASRPELADEFSRRLIDILQQPHDVLGHRLNINASIGVALAPSHGQAPEELLKAADVALYRAKSMGRGRHAIYTPCLDNLVKSTNPLKAELHRSIERNELALHYQPIVDLHTRQVGSFEALMRWKHPTRGMIAPGDFISIAEETGFIVEMGRWAVLQACNDAVGWPQDTKVSVNLSAMQIEASNFYETVTNALMTSGLAANRLQLEITETVLLRDEQAARDTLNRLHTLGVSIALDDFGTCFASLSYLRNFPFDKIKIDRSFVRDLPELQDCRAIVSAVAELARDLRMISVAEGVETLANLQAVAEMGCDEVQGFYFSPPVPNKGIPRVLAQCKSKLNSFARQQPPANRP